MRLQVSFKIMRTIYDTVKEEIVSVEVPDGADFKAHQEALYKLIELSRDNSFLGSSDDCVVRIMTAASNHKAYEAGRIDGIAKAANKDDEPWKLKSRIADLEQQLARKECQIDGIIKSKNPDYVAMKDRENTEDL